MKMVYTHTNPALVGLARSILETEGLEVMIKNEFATAGIPPYNLDQELWVLHDSDAEKARVILAELDEAPDQDPNQD